MDIRVELDERGLIPDRFAKHADAKYLYANTPTRSFPIEIVDIPNEAKSIALTFFDYDSIPVSKQTASMQAFLEYLQTTGLYFFLLVPQTSRMDVLSLLVNFSTMKFQTHSRKKSSKASGLISSLSSTTS